MSSALVQQIIIEAKGNTAHVEAAIAQLRGELKGLKNETTSAGAAGGTLGNRYGSAAIGISSAAENMARLGKVTGESAKMMINQSAQVAFAFGSQGMLIGAIGITTLAIVEMFGRAKKEAKEAAAAITADFNRIAGGGVKGTKATINKLTFGERFVAADATNEQLGVLRIMQQIDELQRKVNSHQASSAEVAALAKKRGALDEINGRLKAYNQLLTEQEQAEARIAAAEQELKNAKEGSADADRKAKELHDLRVAAAAIQIEQMTSSWEAGMDRQAEAIKARDAVAKKSADDLIDGTAKLADKLAVEMVKTTKTLVDDIRQKYDAWIAEASGIGNTGLAERFKNARDAAMALQQTIEDLDDASRELGLDFKDVADASQGGIKPENFNAIADAIERAARGGIQLAEAIGLVSANASKSLQAIAQIAVSLPQLRAASQAGQWSGASGVIASALPVVGGIATMVDSFLSAGKAAREHAKALREAAQRFTESLQERVSGYGLTEAQQSRRDIEKDQRDALSTLLENLIQNRGIRIGTREDFFKADPADQRKILTGALASEKAKFPAGFESSLMRALEAAIEQFDLIAEAAKNAAAELEAENEAKRASFDQSLEERRLRLAGDDAAADATALLTQHEQELAAARKEGIYTAEQLAELARIQAAEEKKAAEAAQKRREDEDRATAQTAARRTEDLQSRINAADGESPAERAMRVQIEHRRELEDAMADGADAATLALIQLAQAAGDAAAAQAALTAAQRDMEDLDVRLLRAQGKGTEADRADFANRQRRELEDAQAAGKDAAYLDKLRTTQADELKAFLQGLVEEVAGGGGATAGTAARAAGRGVSSSSIQNITLTQADRLVSLTGTLVAYAHEELALIKNLVASVLVTRSPLLPPALPSSFTVGAGGQMVQVRVTIANNFYGNVEGGTAGAENLSAEMLRAINAGLGAEVVRGILGRGDASR